MDLRTYSPRSRPMRRDRLLREAVHDSYKVKSKLPEPTACPDCGAVFHDGHWQWMDMPENAHMTCCPACQRMRDHYPAGYVSLAGSFFAEHEQEIMQLVRHHEDQERAMRPLQRIMSIDATKDGSMITTTDTHLARGIGEALRRAYRGKLRFHYNPAQNLLRVNWVH